MYGGIIATFLMVGYGISYWPGCRQGWLLDYRQSDWILRYRQALKRCGKNNLNARFAFLSLLATRYTLHPMATYTKIHQAAVKSKIDRYKGVYQ